MRVKDVISLVDSYEPNAYDKDTKTRWVRECEGKVYSQLFLVQPDGFSWGSPSDYRETELAIPAPYNQIYAQYLRAMIHYANAEPDRYNMDIQLFNQTWHDLCVWFGQDYDVSDRARNKRVQAELPMEWKDREYYVSYAVLNIPERCALVGGQFVYRNVDSGAAEVELSAGTQYGVEIEPITMTPGRGYMLPMVIAPTGGATLYLKLTYDYSSEEPVTGENAPKLFFSGRLLTPEEEFCGWKKIQVEPVVVAQDDLV